MGALEEPHLPMPAHYMVKSYLLIVIRVLNERCQDEEGHFIKEHIPSTKWV